MQLTLQVDNVATGVVAGLVGGIALGGLLVAHCQTSSSSCISSLCPEWMCPKGCCKTKKVLKDDPKYKVDQTSKCPASGKEGTSCPMSGAGAGKEEKGVEVVEAAEEEGERAAERPAFWFEENLTEVYSVKMELTKLMFDSRSDFQRVQVVETSQFGKTLVLDGQTQSAEKDEKVYHECLVHPAMLQHPDPKRVFIGGGGEFATAREVLRHTSVERCVMVDIDKVACDICREQLPEWGNGAYEDERFHVEYMDARVWLEESEEKFDVIIMDICDPIEAGPGYRLYTEEFYNFLQTRLTPGGVVVTQSGPGAIYNAKEECFSVINNTLSSAFNCVVPYVVDVPSFGCVWGFNMAMHVPETEGQTKEQAGALKKVSIVSTPSHEIDSAIAARIPGEMFFLDGVSYGGITGIPKSIRQACEEEDRVMTIDNPVFMYSG